MFDEEFKESRLKVQQLMRGTALDSPWVVPAVDWLKKTYEISYETRFFGMCPPKKVSGEVVNEALGGLMSVYGLSEAEAKNLGEKMKDW